MELINTKTKTSPYSQTESSSETQPSPTTTTTTTITTTTNTAKTKSLLLLKHCNNSFFFHHNQEMVVAYKECLKNHAASMGGHALDGCGEFMPSPSASLTDPSSLRCAACGCHRNFHRRDPYDGNIGPPAYIHHLPPPPPLPNPVSSSPSPTHSHSPTNTPPSPVPYSYYSSAPHMLLALSTGYSGPSDEFNHHVSHSNPTVGKLDMNNNNNNNSNNNPSGKKRSRTKFSKEQKEKMHAFAEKLGWKMPRNEEKLLMEEFCNEVGVDRGVFKIWMHNNKNVLGKKEINLGVGNLNLDSNNHEYDEDFNGNGNGNAASHDIHNNEGSNIQNLFSTINGSSSAS